LDSFQFQGYRFTGAGAGCGCVARRRSENLKRHFKYVVAAWLCLPRRSEAKAGPGALVVEIFDRTIRSREKVSLFSKPRPKKSGWR